MNYFKMMLCNGTYLHRHLQLLQFLSYIDLSHRVPTMATLGLVGRWDFYGGGGGCGS